ncbi:hypothetical protein Y032_0390g552 [Ancylostoma ceylanicum]|uniref:ADP-ribosylation factor family protein n=3 Tax=Ancylostoma ceylanicum TaxID=53326 RepID=A0A016RT67_9BILA|nr:hypothetical protein Y032_0390g552 [Ancylostoma ceylanicum]
MWLSKGFELENCPASGSTNRGGKGLHKPIVVIRVVDYISTRMGFALSRLRMLWFGRKPCRILMVGLDNAGKTTVLYKLKLGEVITTIPTIGFNLETVEYRNVSFTVWDVGGQQRIRALWKYYFRDTEALIFVVDSADQERLEEARQEIHTLTDDLELRDAVMLVFANKQDMPNALSAAEITRALELHSIKGREVTDNRNNC